MRNNEAKEHQPLKRGAYGSTTAAAMLPVEPSFVFDEGRGTVVSTQQGSQPLAASSRQRPCFATAQDLDDALLQAIQGKINRKNAWVSKDASNLLEGIAHTVESTLDAATATDEYTSFAKVATVVEGCSKVWTSRVDSTYQRSNQMVRRLLRNEEENCGSDDEGNEAGGEDSAAAAAAAERRRKAAQRRAQSVRTIAIDPSEINLDSKGRMLLVKSSVSAQFRAITEKFDQGNAQGLLLNNTPLGTAGNLILDVDYARETGREYSARRSRLNAGSRRVKQEQTDAEATTASYVMEEYDTGFGEPVDFPLFPSAMWTASSAAQSPRISGGKGAGDGVGGISRLSGDSKVKKEGEGETSRPSAALPSLLLLPHAAALATEGVVNDGQSIASLEQRKQQQQQERGLYESATDPLLFPLQKQQPFSYDDDNGNADCDMDGGDWGGGMDYGYDNIEDFSNGGGGGGEANGSVTNNKALRERVVTEARNLVSGLSELNAIDSSFFGKNRLALEAEDPTSWFPLAKLPTNALRGDVTHKSELFRLHKEHRFTQSSAQAQVGVTTPGKRVKREKTIAFDLPGELAATSAAAAANGGGGGGGDGDSGSSSFLISSLLGDGILDSSSLKQSTSVGKNMTPLGKELLLGKDPSAVLAFTQSVVQRAKAQEAGLLLPEPPVPGKSILSFLPYPINVESFFQPFSTPLSQWNMLRKSATGCTIGLNSSVNQQSRRASGVLENNGWNRKRDDDTMSQFGGGDDDGTGSGLGAVGAMPAEFFHGGAEADDDYMGAGGYDNYGDDAADYGGAAGDHLLQIEAQIMSNFERSELARLSTALTTLSDGVKSGTDEFKGLDPMAFAKVLHSPQTALPSQVDVVKLRQAMWSSLSDVLGRNSLAKQQGQEGQECQPPARQRGRRGAGRKRPPADTGEQEISEEEKSEGLARFSEVVLPILPQVPLLSATGTLSPAFFFFSILFLANEHGVLLESVPGLHDLVVRGVDQPVTATAVE